MAPSPSLRGLKASKRDPREILRARIAKRSYVFDVKRFFVYNKPFKVQKAPSGVDAVRAAASAQLKSMARPAAPSMPKLRPPPGLGRPLLIILAIFALLLGALALYILSVIGSAAPPAPLEAKASFAYWLSGPALLSHGTGEDSAFYVSASINATGIGDAWVLLQAFNNSVPSAVYLVSARSQEASSLPQFAKALEGELRRRGSQLRSMDVGGLQAAAAEGPAIFILPTGFMPSQLLGINSSGDFAALLRNGSVLIYSGYELTSTITPEGDIAPAEKFNVSIAGRYGISFQKPAQQFKGLRAQAPLYYVSPVSRSSSVRTVYGSVYAYELPAQANSTSGYLVLIPQTLDAGWQGNGSAAAEDFLRIIDSVAWLAPSVRGELSLENATSGQYAVITEPESGIPHSGLYLHALVTYSANSTNRSQAQALGKYADDTTGGSMRHAPSALQTGITGEKLPMMLTNLPQERVQMRIEAYKNGLFKNSQDVGEVIRQRQYFYTVELEPGDYALELKGPGGVYARSFLHVPALSFQLTDAEWGSGRLSYQAFSDGLPVAQLQGIRASIDGKYLFDVSTSTGKFALDAKAPLDPGAHAVEFDMGPYKVSYKPAYNRILNWWEKLEYQLAVLAMLGLFYLGAALRRPDKVFFSLDVPDFPPASKITAPVPRQRVIELFNDVNREYKWRYMPLSLAEVKNGFRRVLVRGRPLLIGDYNAERIMEQLEKRGDAVRVQDMYALRSWENESGRSARYLYIFRKMRDALVNIAVPFTEIGRSQDYDSLITLGDEQVAVHVYDGKREVSEIVAKAVKNARARRQLILFAGDSALDEFSEALDSTSKLFVSAKMQLQAGRVALTTIERLAQFLKGQV